MSFSRQQYLNKECSIEEYYTQYVTPLVLDTVLKSISKEKILSSKCPSFSDIPLKTWVILANRIPIDSQLFEDNGDYPTKAGLVCIAKQAARQYKQSKQ